MNCQGRTLEDLDPCSMDNISSLFLGNCAQLPAVQTQDTDREDSRFDYALPMLERKGCKQNMEVFEYPMGCASVLYVVLEGGSRAFSESWLVRAC